MFNNASTCLRNQEGDVAVQTVLAFYLRNKCFILNDMKDLFRWRQLLIALVVSGPVGTLGVSGTATQTSP